MQLMIWLARGPGAAGDGEAEVVVRQLAGAVGVGVDAEEAAGRDGGAGVQFIEIQPRIAGVDLQGGACSPRPVKRAGKSSGRPSRALISRPVGWPMTFTYGCRWRADETVGRLLRILLAAAKCGRR